MTDARSSKVWRRTRTGALIVGGLSALLWASGREGGEYVVLLGGGLVAALAIFELDRMGSLAGKGRAWALLPPLFFAVLFGLEAIHRQAVLGGLGEDPNSFESAIAESYLYLPALGWELLIVVAVAFLLQAAVGLMRSRRPLLGSAIVAWAIYFPSALFHSDLYPDIAGVDGGPGTAAAALGAAVAIVTLAFGVTRRPGLGAAAAAALLALWLVPALPWLQYVHGDYGNGGLIALFVLSKLGDTAGYYVGSAIGKHHPFKRLSPGKTTEGCLASLAAGIGAGALCVSLGLLPSEPLGLLGGLLAGGAINLASQAGDLLESWVKRRAGVKDSGTWFGPSGGVLDLIDSLLLSVPVALVVWPLLFDRAAQG